MHTSIAVAGLLVTGVSALELATGSYTFEEFATTYGRRGGAEEMATRKAIFKRNLAKVVTHNADKTQMYKKGINRFSDWTEEEIEKFITLGDDPNSCSFEVSSRGVYNGTVGKAAALTLDYRKGDVLTPVNDQGNCSCSYAFSTAQSVESAFALKYGELTALSVSQLLECDTGDWGCRGGWPLCAMDWLRHKGSKGLYTALEYPYTESSGQQGKCRDLSKPTSATVRSWWPVTPNVAELMMEALGDKGPMSIVMAVSPAFRSYSSGIFKMEEGDSWKLNHALQLVGYGADESQNGQEYWIVRNSWGTSWGEAGFARMWKAGKGQTEPCNPAGANQQPACGTLGVLAWPLYINQVGKGQQ